MDLGMQGLDADVYKRQVPVYYGHSESINLEFEKPYDLAELKAALAKAPGIVVQDDPQNNVYPMAVTAADTRCV